MAKIVKRRRAFLRLRWYNGSEGNDEITTSFVVAHLSELHAQFIRGLAVIILKVHVLYQYLG